MRVLGRGDFEPNRAQAGSKRMGSQLRCLHGAYFSCQVSKLKHKPHTRTPRTGTSPAIKPLYSAVLRLMTSFMALAVDLTPHYAVLTSKESRSRADASATKVFPDFGPAHTHASSWRLSHFVHSQTTWRHQHHPRCIIRYTRPDTLVLAALSQRTLIIAARVFPRSTPSSY